MTHRATLVSVGLLVALVYVLAGVVAAFLVLGCAAVAASGIGRAPAVQRWLAADGVRRERARIDAERHGRLRAVSSPRTKELTELIALVRDVDDDLRDTLELEELIEQYTHAAVALELYGRIAARTDPPLKASLDPPPHLRRSGSAHLLQEEIHVRRREHGEDCARRAEELGFQLDGVAELIRLSLDRAATPWTAVDLEVQLRWRIRELDTCDEALEQLDVELLSGAASPDRTPPSPGS